MNNQHEHLGLARGAADSLLKIVDHLLDFSVIEKGNPGFDNKEFDLNRLIESLTDYCSNQLELKSIDMKVNVDGQVPIRLYGDSNRLFQILKNLMNNTALGDPGSVFEVFYDGGATGNLVKPITRDAVVEELHKFGLLEPTY